MPRVNCESAECVEALVYCTETFWRQIDEKVSVVSSHDADGCAIRSDCERNHIELAVHRHQFNSWYVSRPHLYFYLPSGKSFTGLSGKFSITQSNGAGNLGEALLLLWTAPSGQTCDLAHRESPGFGAYIVKTMNANGTQDTGDISLSEVTNEGVRLNDGCVILYMSAGSTSGSLRATSTLVLTYATPPNAETTDGLGGEEYFDSSLHANGDFAYVWVAPSAVTVDKLRGNVSDAAYNDVGVTWTIQHDFYYYAASDCTAQFGGVTGEYGPGSYYSNILGSAVHLFQAGSNSEVHKDAQQHLINNNLNQSVAAGGCIVALSKQTSGIVGAGIDDELQVSVDYH